MISIIYVPITILIMFVTMYVSYKSNSNQEIKWIFYNWLLFCCTPIWIFIAYYSRNLVLDSIIFNSVLVVSCTLFSMYFANKYNMALNLIETIGIFTMMIGLIIFKIGDLVK